MGDSWPLMLFAAGFGRRMAPLTHDRPKPLIRVAGRALIDHALDLGVRSGSNPIVVNTHYRAEMIHAHLAQRPDIIFSDETGEILETGGGLKKALPLLGAGPVQTMNTDCVWAGPNPLSSVRRHWDPARMDAMLLLVRKSDALGHSGPGDFDCGPNDGIARGSSYVYSGVQIISAQAVLAEPGAVFSMNRVWDRIAAAGRLCGTVHEGGWCDVGHPASIGIAEALLASVPP